CRQELLGDGASGDSSRGFARARATAPAVVAEAIFAIVGVVGVPGPIFVFDVGVVFALGVRVADQDGDAGAGGPALEDTGQDLGLVRLLTLRHDLALAGAPARQIHRQ